MFYGYSAADEKVPNRTFNPWESRETPLTYLQRRIWGLEAMQPSYILFGTKNETEFLAKVITADKLLFSGTAVPDGTLFAESLDSIFSHPVAQNNAKYKGKSSKKFS